MDSDTAFNLRLVSYVDVACLVLLTYDTLLKMDLEYRYIWKSKWSFIKGLYLWSRYATFLDTAVAVLTRLDTNIDPSTCNTFSKFNTIFAGFGIGITEIILMTRTYALYGRSKKLLAFFMVLWLSVGGVCTWAVLSLNSSDAPPSSFISCALETSSSVLLVSNVGLVCYICLLAGETIIVLLTVWKGVRSFYLAGTASRSSHLIVSFYVDGIMFYLIMLLIFIIVVVIQNTASPMLRSIGVTPLRVTHSILSCHLVIHVRVVAAENEVTTMSTKSPLVFANLPAESRRGVDTVV
jgi:hypothetical protein